MASYRRMGRTLLELQRAADQVFDAVSLKVPQYLVFSIAHTRLNVESVSSFLGQIIKQPPKFDIFQMCFFLNC